MGVAAIRQAAAVATARHRPRTSASTSASTFWIRRPGRVTRARERSSVRGTAESRSTAIRVIRIPSPPAPPAAPRGS
ncbi:MAG: hypothetical protein Q4P43_00195 [Corynebacterium sphenisci]|nr:hypothetical protein [Corynebacterium sphenisci]MDO5730021.1 hypothetical protein [Corynebacterium sphenisci]